MKEIAFQLQTDGDGWPPVGAEWLWIESIGQYHIVKNSPLFISGLAVDDQIEICRVNSDGQVTKWKLVKPSDRSVVWIADTGGGRLNEILNQLRAIGCNTVSMNQYAVASVDVPSSVTKGQIDDIVGCIDGHGYAIAFPCDRQV